MTDQDQLSDLAFIRKTMEQATRYTNVPPGGQLAAGVLGLAGVVTTWIYLGFVPANLLYWSGCHGMTDDALLADCGVIHFGRLQSLGFLWTFILAAAALISIAFAARRARRHGFSAWNSLARRMFLSQVPLLGVGALLTLALYKIHEVQLIPGWWLLCYGLLLFSFHYFTGRDHLRQAIIFLVLGLAALFLPLSVALILLGVGFGLVNIAFGIKGLIWRPAEP